METDFTPRELVDLGRESIARQAWVASQAENFDRKTCVMFCILVDTYWRPVVEFLMPGRDWDSIRQRGEHPVAVGHTTWEKLSPLLRDVPVVLARAKGLALSSDGALRLIALTQTECLVTEIEPRLPGHGECLQ